MSEMNFAALGVTPHVLIRNLLLFHLWVIQTCSYLRVFTSWMLRKVEFQEHPPVPHYYEDRQNHGRDAERSHDMHHLMADTKLSDFNASHHHEEHHLQEEHHMHEENRSHAVSREVSHASHVMPREASHHAAPRQVSRHPSREISHHPPRQVSHQLSHDYRQQSHVDYTDHNKAW